MCHLIIHKITKIAQANNALGHHWGPDSLMRLRIKEYRINFAVIIDINIII